MTRPRLNAIIDCAMALFFLPCVYSAFIIHRVLDPARGAGRDVLPFVCFGLHRFQWTRVHIWTGWLFTALVAAHLFLHIPWIRSMPRIFRREKT